MTRLGDREDRGGHRPAHLRRRLRRGGRHHERWQRPLRQRSMGRGKYRLVRRHERRPGLGPDRLRGWHVAGCGRRLGDLRRSRLLAADPQRRHRLGRGLRHLRARARAGAGALRRWRLQRRLLRRLRRRCRAPVPRHHAAALEHQPAGARHRRPQPHRRHHPRRQPDRENSRLQPNHPQPFGPGEPRPGRARDAAGAGRYKPAVPDADAHPVPSAAPVAQRRVHARPPP